MRLDKFLADATPHSRSTIKTFLKKRQVTVNGETVLKADINVSEKDIVTLSGVKISLQPKYCYIILNKPAGYVCATEDNSDPTVMELIPPEMQTKGLFPAGRLDKDTTGMVLITNDGDFAHKMLSPKHHVPKYYHVTLARPFEESYISELEKGIILSNGDVCLPAQVAKIPDTENEALICLHEGKYHQVKRMFAALGNHVFLLHRIGIGDLILPEDLPKGSCKLLIDEDAKKIMNFGGNFLTKLHRIKKSSS